MPVSPVGSSVPIKPIEFPSLGGTDAAQGAEGTQNFGNKLAESLDNLQQTQATSDQLALQVASGQLTDIHDYMIAANKAEIATQLTVAVRNKAVESFNQIMNMQV